MARHVLQGRAGSSGSGIGRLVRVWTTPTPVAPPPRVEAFERRHEQDRLRRALAQAVQELAQLAEQTRVRAGEDVGAIFEAQALFVNDPALVDSALTAIAEDGVSAVEA